MPFLFVLALLGAVAAAAGAAWWALARAAKASTTGATVALAAGAAVFLLFTLFASWNQVGTQNVGVVTSFGRPVGDLSNGLHFTAPWEAVTEMDNQIETDVYEGKSCIEVRIAGQQTACADVRIVWQMRQSAADELFRQYQNPASVRSKLVFSELYTAMNDQFDGYDPIGSLTSVYKLGSPQNPTVPQVARAVTAQMQREIGDRVRVYAVLVPIINYDATVQRQLNAVLTQQANTDVALQAEKTALAQAAAAKDLAQSSSLTQPVLVQNCLNLTGEAMKAGYSLPQGWNCLGSSSVGVITSGK